RAGAGRPTLLPVCGGASRVKISALGRCDSRRRAPASWTIVHRGRAGVKAAAESRVRDQDRPMRIPGRACRPTSARAARPICSEASASSGMSTMTTELSPSAEAMRSAAPSSSPESASMVIVTTPVSTASARSRATWNRLRPLALPISTFDRPSRYWSRASCARKRRCRAVGTVLMALPSTSMDRSYVKSCTSDGFVTQYCTYEHRRSYDFLAANPTAGSNPAKTREGTTMKHLITGRGAIWAAIGMVGALALAGCGGAGGSGGGGGDEVNVLMVNNPQMKDLQKLTADHFTEDTGIEVNYTVLPENEVRAKIGQEFSAQAGNYDVAS